MESFTPYYTAPSDEATDGVVKDSNHGVAGDKEAACGQHRKAQ